MAGSTGLVLAAGGIALANEAVFAPAERGTPPAINWRIVPATVILAVTLAGLEQLAPGFARGLAGLVVLTVLLVPVGNAGTPLDNLTKMIGVP